MSNSTSSRVAAVCAFAIAGAIVSAQQQPPPTQPATSTATASLVEVRAIQPPDKPLPSEAESAAITKFSFIAYGDTRGQADGVELQRSHTLVVDRMLEKIAAMSTTAFPVRFVIQSGDAVANGRLGQQLNVSYIPIIERLTRGAGLPYFFSVGNHDVTSMPIGDVGRELGLRNTLSANARLIPAEGSKRRLNAYPTYTFGYGHAFFIALDSQIAADPVQLKWVTGQLEGLDRVRYRHVIAFFHHPPFSSGPHGGEQIERQTLAVRDLYAPLFRKHHVRMTVAGHDHLYDHWVERYDHNGQSYRRDDIVTGGGGAPIYTYRTEPNLNDYQAAGRAQNLRVQHLASPGPLNTDNPHHFVVIELDGDRVWLEVVGISPFAPFGGRSRIELTDRVS